MKYQHEIIAINEKAEFAQAIKVRICRHSQEQM